MTARSNPLCRATNPMQRNTNSSGAMPSTARACSRSSVVLGTKFSPCSMRWIRDPRHPEGVDQLVALGLVVDLDAVERLQQEAGGAARHVGGLAPALVDLVQHQRGGRTGPQGRAEREEAHQPHLEGGRLGEEHVGVEVDDEAVEAPGEPRQAAHAARVVQVEVVVRGRRPGREHLDVVALAAQRPHLLHGIGADAVAVGRVGRHEQDALGHDLGGGGRFGHGERAHCQASRLASTRSSVTGQV